MQANTLPITSRWLAAGPARALSGVALLAMVIASAYASVPLPFGPVPMTLQSLAVLMAGVWGGPRLGAAVCATYLATAALGLPVLAGGTVAPGATLLLRPTAGYLLAFPVAAAVAGIIAGAHPNRLLSAALAMAAGHVVIFAGGLAYLCTFMPLERAVSVGVVPFLAGTVVKVALGALLAVLGEKASRFARWP